MTRETKMGLLVGMGLIIMIGILISDHLSASPNDNEPASQSTQQPRVNSQDPAVTPPVLDNTTNPLPPAIEDRDEFNERQRQRRRNVDGLGILANPNTVYDPDATTPNDERRRMTRRRVIGVPETHVVISGDNGSKISLKHYGSTRYWKDIVAANPDQLDSVRSPIYTDMVLVLPDIPGTDRWTPNGRVSELNVQDNSSQQPRQQPQRENTPQTEARQDSNNATETYVVQRGDTLWRISEKLYGDPTRRHEIYELNKSRMAAPDRISAGQRLIVPKR